MVKKIRLGDDKIVLTTNKRKAPKSFSYPTSKRLFLTVDNGSGLEGYLPLDKSVMAGNSGTNTSSATANMESEANKTNENEMLDAALGENMRVPEKGTVKDLEIHGLKQKEVNVIILNTLKDAIKERKEMSDYMKMRFENIESTVNRVEEKTKEINDIKEDVGTIKKNYEEMNKRVIELENSNAKTSHEIKEHFKRMEVEERGRRELKTQILKEIETNEKCVVIFNYPLESNDKVAVLEDLLVAILKVDVPSGNFRPTATIDYMRKKEGTKPSLIVLNVGSKELRQSLLVNSKKDTKIRVKKAYPARYAAAQKELDNLGYAIRVNHPEKFFTDLQFEGTTLNLVYRAKIPGLRTEWRIKKSFNPFDNKEPGGATAEEPSLDNTAMIVTLPAALESNGEVVEALTQVLNEKATFSSLKALSNKEAAIKFDTPAEVKKAEQAILLKYGVRKSKVVIV